MKKIQTSVLEITKYLKKKGYQGFVVIKKKKIKKKLGDLYLV